MAGPVPAVQAAELVDHVDAAGDTINVASDLTLQQVVENTIARNPRLQVISARLQEVMARRQQADSWWAADPAVSLRHQNDELGSDDGLLEWETGLEFPLWLPGQKVARREVADKSDLEIAASEAALRLTIAAVVRELLWDIALKENQASIARNEWEVARGLAEDVEKRVELGDLAQTDLIVARQDALEREAAYRQARGEFRHALHRYHGITGLEQIPETFSESPIDVTEIGLDHPLLAEPHASVIRATADRDQARIERRANPSLTVGTRHERASAAEEYANSIGLIFRLPLGLESQTTPALAAADLALAERMSERDLRKQQLQLELEDAVREQELTREAIVFAERQHALSQENLRLARRAFSLGETDLVNLIRVQSQAFAAERSLRQRRLELQRNVARLNQALGRMP